MKKIIAYIFAGAVLVFAASCSRESIGQAEDGDAFALQVFCSELTKAGTTPGVGNENKVVSLDYFFYADTVSSPAVFHYRDAEPTPVSGKYQGIFTPGLSYGGSEFPTREVLYGANDHTTVFIVANLPEAKVPATLPKWDDLKAIALDQAFMAEGAALATDSDAMEFVMTAQVDARGNVTGVFTNVGLERLAAKMDFDITVAKSVTLEGTLDGDGGTYTETWTPMLNGNNVRVYLQQAVTNTVLGAADGAHYPASLSPADYNPIVPASWSADNETTVGPFYTFPVSWKDDVAQAPFGKIIVPWKVVRTDSNGNVFYSAQREVYYKVVLPDYAILSNNYYKFTVDITVVGTETDPEVIIDATYQVADWTNGGAGKVNTQISDIKYLTVDRKKENNDGIIEVFVPSAQVQYSASETAVIDWENSSIYYLDYITSGLTDHKRYIIENGTFNNNNGKNINDDAIAKGWVTLNEVENPNSEIPDTYITLNHTMINDLANNYFDATPYFYDITIKLSTGGAEPKVVHLKQYPQSYIEEMPNSGDDPHTVWYNAGTNWNPIWEQRTLGYVYVNGQHEDATDGSYGGVNGLTGGNQNGNMYIVTTSVISDANKTIGDPRIAKGTYDNINGWNPANASAAPVSGGNKRQLTYYKRTEGGRNNNDRTRYMISPSFRVASSYGVTSSLNFDDASRRCASYQEDGYPAGRWRLPTAAEIEYCVTLSAKGRLPRLFGEQGRSTDYWSANGYITVNGNNVDPEINSFTGNRYIRCVYDDWYWGHDRVAAAQHTFMWGDEEDQ